jgi:hypothetical protein
MYIQMDGVETNFRILADSENIIYAAEADIESLPSMRRGW